MLGMLDNSIRLECVVTRSYSSKTLCEILKFTFNIIQITKIINQNNNKKLLKLNFDNSTFYNP